MGSHSRWRLPLPGFLCDVITGGSAPDALSYCGNMHSVSRAPYKAMTVCIYGMGYVNNEATASSGQ
eukprot:scaffold27713_cov17-Tisochrysis_lutea.AAC.1